MFDKILIANRGEIACRIMRTAKRMGVRTVAVHSDADAGALHVRMADEAVAIGPPPVGESYLRIDGIVEACVDSGAQAVHPGYGLLSENAAFAEALEARGIAFVGPGPRAIEAMGDKLAAKRLAERAGVSVLPGAQDAVADADRAVAEARGIGYPVMLKAAAGGGGKGMRIASDDTRCLEAFERAASEARASFGDGRIFVEKFVERSRHIEIQILADAHGNVVHLGERECSLQRRHQKIVEEAPSPLLDAEIRDAMGEQAVALARAVGYRSAGTVEFVVGQDRRFYLLEMNTRLQVEHPVTELVTGLDLVEWMLRIAAGERLDVTQESVRFQGWAIEARLYAEDPAHDFVPSAGRLVRYRIPSMDSVRLDSGVEEGDEVSMFYDPMIAKLAAHGGDRDMAIERLLGALDGTRIAGLRHNAGFLSALLSHPDFVAGKLDTEFIADAFPDGFTAAAIPDEDMPMWVAIAVAVQRATLRRAAGVSDWPCAEARPAREVWMVFFEGRGPWQATARSVDYRIAVVVEDGPEQLVASRWHPGEPFFDAAVGELSIRVAVEPTSAGFILAYRGYAGEFKVLTRRAADLEALMPPKRDANSTRFLRSPMPGLLVTVFASEGEEVVAGQELAVVEAMKMENTLRAPGQRKVARILASPGDSLTVDQPILEFA